MIAYLNDSKDPGKYITDFLTRRDISDKHELYTYGYLYQLMKLITRDNALKIVYSLLVTEYHRYEQRTSVDYINKIRHMIADRFDIHVKLCVKCKKEQIICQCNKTNDIMSIVLGSFVEYMEVSHSGLSLNRSEMYNIFHHMYFTKYTVNMTIYTLFEHLDTKWKIKIPGKEQQLYSIPLTLSP